MSRTSQSKVDLKVDYSIDIVKLSKRFKRRTLKKGGYTTLKTTIVNWLFRRQKEEATFTQAISDFTARIPRGASLGIIGRNGSGKSTLLKLISGIYKADEGSISINGRIAALIELGAGFHPDFTGRENLYLGGIMHGLSRDEIDARFDEIVRFAELEHVIDDPVRTYSSGMYMRLGFSLAVHTDPDILIVDEVLAVGDAAFVAKCKEKISGLKKSGKTLLLVSHDLGAVEQWCDEVIWIDRGKEMDRGNPRRVIDKYRAWVEKSEEKRVLEESQPEPVSEKPVLEKLVKGRWGSREVEITSIRLLDKAGAEHGLFHTGDKLILEMSYVVNETVTDVVFGMGLNRSDGVVVLGTNTDIASIKVPALTGPGLTGRGVVRFEIDSLILNEGTFFIDAAVHRQDGYPYDYHQSVIKFLVRSAHPHVGVVVFDHKWKFLPESSVSKAAHD